MGKDKENKSADKEQHTCACDLDIGEDFQIAIDHKEIWFCSRGINKSRWFTTKPRESFPIAPWGPFQKKDVVLSI